MPEPMAAEEPIEPEPMGDDDVLELTDDMMMPDAGTQKFEAMAESEPEPMPEPVFEPEPIPEPEPIRAPPPPPPPPPPPRAAAMDMGGDSDGIVSGHTATAATSLFHELAMAVARERGVGVGHGVITLEDIVREMLRPILKEWLDANLAYIIERMVKKEIEKMVERAEGL